MKPNILFLFPDQWRGDWWGRGRNGLPVRTPVLNELADEGTTFTHAVTPAPLCAPARAALATGRAYPAYGIVDNSTDLPLDADTVYRAMQNGGYHVMGCGKFDLHKASYSWGSSGDCCLNEWGFHDGIDNEGKIDGVDAFRAGAPGPYLTYLASRNKAELHVDDFGRRVPFGTFPTPLEPEEYCDNWVTRNALDLLSAAPADKPWFLQVNFTGPHDPFDITEEMSAWYENAHFDNPFGTYDPCIDHLGLRRNYAAMIENIDRNIGAILNHPRIRRERKRTVIVFASDHGEMLGDHGHYGKCTPHNGSVHVPVIICGPSVDSGRVFDRISTIADLTATFADIAGVCSGTNERSFHDSQSLLQSLRVEPPKEKSVVSSLSRLDNPAYQWRSVITDEHKFIRWEDGSVALFAWDDYEELNDLSEVLPEVVEMMQRSLPANPRETGTL